ncbi:uncharacterized protein B0H64DRAFT_404915 [Chaetomium fimeti]|uniref:MutL C-terminal dimerisation domain-containing protein n=1 Tax=Chaetomium fimeti TaxID=1854472 RepID=A0AAE0HBP4_9PEZI|nr:hypothetical protein B0H64DRAFT_404915 [Chaetomium fimeti]
MLIQPLPEDVVAQIKSSTVITSLNAAVCGLLQNSLDSGASKVNISVDYSRGNCTVEDDGCGITPASFEQGGGLGQLHYTSKYPPRPECHGKRGEFLSSLAALSLLSVASHHRDYRTHNSLTIHNSRVISRNLPAPPEQRVLAFMSGTRVGVRDLFGSMPVRVKQRAIEVERAGTSKEFDQLIFKIVSTLLPWPGEVFVSAQDSCARRTVSLQVPSDVGLSRTSGSTGPSIASRTTSLLTQASLLNGENLKLWVPIGATASGISVRGCVSLQPAATKRVQFIALGIQPLLNEHGSNLFYDDVNRMFEISNFGMIEDATIPKDEYPSETQLFTSKQLKPKRGVDRWPMFFLQIMLDSEASLVGVDELLDERRQNVALIADLLQVMTYEFLKKHHFRPKSTAAVERLKRPKRNSAVVPSPPPTGLSAGRRNGQVGRRDGRSPSSHKPRKHIRPPSNTHTDGKQLASPFMFWSKTKPHTQEDPGLKTTGSPTTAQNILAVTRKPENLLFDKSGGLLRKPFDDVADTTTAPGNDPSGNPPCDLEVDTRMGSARDTVVWVDPTSKIKSLIDSRTGFAVKPSARVSKTIQPRPGSNERLGDISRSKRWKPTEAEEHKTTIQATESRIPQVFQAFNSFCCDHGGGNFESRDLGNLTAAEYSNGNVLATLEGRISKASLRLADVVAQVDQKFILTKVGADPPPTSTGSRLESDHLLILIDQHAADERCKVENLLAAYFVPGPTPEGQLVAQTQPLDKPLRFDVSKQDGELLARFRKHFAHWGVVYEVTPEPLPRVTVEAQSLPPSIVERCRLEPRLLIDLLRKEVWKLHDTGSSGTTKPVLAGRDNGWVARFHDCPDGIMDLINSRACRSAIMFNDPLTVEQCSGLVHQLAACAFPFQCAHGRPSMVPLVHLGQNSIIGSGRIEPGEKGDLLRALKRLKRASGDSA